MPKVSDRPAILWAEGLAAGLEKIAEVGRGLDPNTMRLQYLETLKDVGAAPSTKIVVPMELGGLIGGLQALLPGAPANNFSNSRREQQNSRVQWSGRPASLKDR